MAHTQLHAIYTALVVALQNTWTFLQRVVPGEDEYRVLEEVICVQLTPSMLGHASSLDEPERFLLSVPTRFGGLSICRPDSDVEFEASEIITKPLVALLVGDV